MLLSLALTGRFSSSQVVTSNRYNIWFISFHEDNKKSPSICAEAVDKLDRLDRLYGRGGAPISWVGWVLLKNVAVLLRNIQIDI
jgi:hypothetical protein